MLLQLITYNSEVTELMFMFRTEQLTQKQIRLKPSAPSWLLPQRRIELLQFSLAETLTPVGHRRQTTIWEKWAAEACSIWTLVTEKKGRKRTWLCENHSFLGISMSVPPLFLDLCLPDCPFGSLPCCPPLFTASLCYTASPSVAGFQPDA